MWFKLVGAIKNLDEVLQCLFASEILTALDNWTERSCVVERQKSFLLPFFILLNVRSTAGNRQISLDSKLIKDNNMADLGINFFEKRELGG